MRRELPPELLKLRLLLNKVEKLTREDVPSLVSEIKRLRSQNKRLEAEAEASQLSLTSDSLDPIDLIEQIEQTEPEGLDHEAIAEATAESGR
jgi:ABC-type phosphate transport system auxiliary subunit